MLRKLIERYFEQKETPDDFWKTVAGGKMGYLQRCLDRLSTNGLDPRIASQTQISDFLGEDVYQRMTEAAKGISQRTRR